MHDEDNKRIADKAGFITKASSQYCDQFPLRAAIQTIPVLGGSLDTMLSGLGAKYQYERLKAFIYELDYRLRQLEGTQNLQQIESSEELFDFIMQIFDQIIKTRSQEKKEKFANLVTNQVITKCKWDEVETASRLLGELSDVEIQILIVALNAEVCHGVFDGLKVVTIADKWCKGEKAENNVNDLRLHFPGISTAALEMLCSNLVAKGLLHDEGLGRWGGVPAMKLFVATNSAKWLVDWISEPQVKSA